ncbi:hypothetical protein PIB30_006905 [Stylosanthes scabra]|uniref:DUF4283 domain-containing protein n=1 Tax=Stylosanthes scabra TaxID=79078 RepID=A0ABU6X634_9FABA|nr:hypothetical protein [Stylosanthes scabra]
MAFEDGIKRKELQEVGIRITNGFTTPSETSLASMESLSLPLVQEVVISADVQCELCQKRISDIITKMNGTCIPSIIHLLIMALIPNQRDGSHASITIPDDEVVSLDASDVKEVTEDFSKSLFGRIMADRSFSFGLIEGSFTAIWNYPEGLTIKSLGDNIYQFSFVKETDMIRVERGSPWLFKQYLVHIQRWNKDMALEASNFSIILMWI